MSSGTAYQMGAGRQMLKVATGSGQVRGAKDRVARLGLTPRQLELNRLWAYYRCQQYDARTVDWNGRKIPEALEQEQIGLQGFLPPGFTDVGGATLPLQFRRPSSPYHLAHLVVSRFTSLLFSEKRHPSFTTVGDPASQEWLGQWARSSRLWAQAIQLRNYGGAQGTGCATFGFFDGRPKVEIHDPRWLFPKFVDRQEHILSELEIRYQFPVEMLNPDTGNWEEVAHWYRRVIDQNRDTVWRAVPIGDGEEPNWADPRLIERQVEHGLGFFPGRWVQNLPVAEAIDGDPDCHGAYDTFDQIDALVSQANKALAYNGDPTPVFATDGQWQAETTRIGSGEAIKLPGGGSASYMEISGASIKAIMDQADALERRALQICQCVLERPDGAAVKTATEVDRVWSSMTAKADIMREQYGGKCLIPLADDVMRAARKLGEPRDVQDGAGGVKLTVYVLRLPKIPTEKDGKVIGWRDAKLGDGNGAQADLTWPRYTDPTLQDAQLAVQSASAAKLGGLVDAVAATHFVAEYFDIEDVTATLAKIKAEQAAGASAMDQSMMAGMGGGSNWGRPPAGGSDEI